LVKKAEEQKVAVITGHLHFEWYTVMECTYVWQVSYVMM